jgi:DNA-binding NtrC family response regulator
MPQNKTILLVDDEDDLREALAEQLAIQNRPYVICAQAHHISTGLKVTFGAFWCLNKEDGYERPRIA